MKAKKDPPFPLPTITAEFYDSHVEGEKPTQRKQYPEHIRPYTEYSVILDGDEEFHIEPTDQEKPNPNEHLIFSFQSPGKVLVSPGTSRGDFLYIRLHDRVDHEVHSHGFILGTTIFRLSKDGTRLEYCSIHDPVKRGEIPFDGEIPLKISRTLLDVEDKGISSSIHAAIRLDKKSGKPLIQDCGTVGGTYVDPGNCSANLCLDYYNNVYLTPKTLLCFKTSNYMPNLVVEARKFFAFAMRKATGVLDSVEVKVSSNGGYGLVNLRKIYEKNSEQLKPEYASPEELAHKLLAFVPENDIFVIAECKDIPELKLSPAFLETNMRRVACDSVHFASPIDPESFKVCTYTSLSPTLDSLNAEFALLLGWTPVAAFASRINPTSGNSIDTISKYCNRSQDIPENFRYSDKYVQLDVPGAMKALLGVEKIPKAKLLLDNDDVLIKEDGKYTPLAEFLSILYVACVEEKARRLYVTLSKVDEPAFERAKSLADTKFAHMLKSSELEICSYFYRPWTPSQDEKMQNAADSVEDDEKASEVLDSLNLRPEDLVACVLKDRWAITGSEGVDSFADSALLGGLSMLELIRVYGEVRDTILNRQGFGSDVKKRFEALGKYSKKLVRVESPEEERLALKISRMAEASDTFKETGETRQFAELLRDIVPEVKECLKLWGPKLEEKNKAPFLLAVYHCLSTLFYILAYKAADVTSDEEKLRMIP